MNDNIQKLYSKVLHESAERWNHPDAEKFAELIVRECAGLVDHVIMEDGTNRGDFIRKHFGVEE
jgi:hypothetical protein